MRPQTSCIHILHKQNAIINHHRTGKKARMGKNTHHSAKNGFPIDTIYDIKKKEIAKQRKNQVMKE
jgi:hypothetical protein